MGEVLAFRPRTESAAPARPEGGAQILFFLGVRYMRMEDPLNGDAPFDAGGADEPPANGARKRRRRAKAS
jgi:hypothetical protein